MNTKTLYTLFLLLTLTGATQAQEMHRWWVTFTDKGSRVYSLAEPSEYLSPRALERRARLGIAVDSLDLPVNPYYLDFLRIAGGTVWAVSRWLNGAVIYAADSIGIAPTLRIQDFVAGVQYYGQASIARTEMEDPPMGIPSLVQPYDTLYGPAYYGLGHYNIGTLNGTGLHRAGHGGEGLLIGVCDGGFPGVESMEVFDQLRQEGRLVATRDFVYGGDSVFDVHSHGTRVLSTMAADLPGLYVGTAPKASYALCRTEDIENESPIEELLWTAAVEYLDSLGVDVVNTSLGYRYYDDPAWNYPPEALDGQTAFMSRAADIAASRGILVVVASGNDGRDPSPNIGVPADSRQALTVGALDHFGDRSVFSSFGPTADGRIKPDVMAPGEQVWVVNPDGTVQEVNGTSFAAPILAGMAACMMGRYPTLGPAAWADSLRAWGSRTEYPDDEQGYGTPDFGLALRGTPAVGIGDSPRITDDAPILRMELYDATGRCLSVSKNADLSPLPCGIYFLRLVTPDGARTRRLVKL